MKFERLGELGLLFGPFFHPPSVIRAVPDKVAPLELDWSELTAPDLRPVYPPRTEIPPALDAE